MTLGVHVGLLIPWHKFVQYIVYGIYGILCHLLFGITQCNNFLFKSKICTNESRIGCVDIVQHE